MPTIHNLHETATRAFRYPVNTKEYDGAWNGIQLDADNPIKHIASAVDCDEQTVDKAIATGVDCLLVHHGLFWNRERQLTGAHGRLVRKLFTNRISVLSYHLPLDYCQVYGNNILLANHIGTLLKPTCDGYTTHLREQTQQFMYLSRPITHEAILTALHQKFKHIKVAQPKTLNKEIQTIGVCTGNGTTVAHDMLLSADMLITGEVQQHIHSLAYTQDRSILALGHYDTETYGVAALCNHLANQHNIHHSSIVNHCEF